MRGEPGEERAGGARGAERWRRESRRIYRREKGKIWRREKGKIWRRGKAGGSEGSGGE
jgi:hypothetical protein